MVDLYYANVTIPSADIQRPKLAIANLNVIPLSHAQELVP